MPTSSGSTDDARPYHHGNLHAALLDAADRLLEREGAGFSLRALAREAGVTHNAPYNHFASKDAVLAAVAAQGFERLGATLRAAVGEVGAMASKDAGTALVALARAYVAFALAHPARFRLMFAAPSSDDPALVQATDAAFAVLRETIAVGIDMGELRPDPSNTHALAAWSLVHGLATLALDGRAGGTLGEAATGEVAATLVEGLRSRVKVVR